MTLEELAHNPEVEIDLKSGIMKGNPVTFQQRKIADLKDVFADEQARLAMPQDQLAYEVQLYQPVSEGNIFMLKLIGTNSILG